MIKNIAKIDFLCYNLVNIRKVVNFLNDQTCLIQIEGKSFTYSHTREPAPPNKAFFLHNHNDNYEVLIFLSGDAEFHVEGSIYYPQPGDVIVVNSNEMHRTYMTSDKIYDRIVINANHGFFCMHPSLKNIFSSRRLGQGNILKLSELQYGIILENCKRIEYYHQSHLSEITGQMIDNLIMEIMYTINQTDICGQTVKSSDKRIKNILAYINDNLTQKLTLENISSKFYINKYHLCRIFKATTGMTVNKYINCKRILLVKELHANGKSFTDASLEAGFENYATFYSVYRREMGVSPRIDMQNKV